MNKHLAAYGAATLTLLALDGVWLGWLARDFYQQGLGHLMADSPRWLPALLFYAMYPLGLLYFALLPSSADTRWTWALRRGVLLGMFAYGTYDLSNWATLRDWPALVSLVDVAWGALASGLAALAGRWASHRFGKLAP
jgi:uncharacterized membrane protein